MMIRRPFQAARNEFCYDNKNIHLRAGKSCYYVSSTLNDNCGGNIVGDGARGRNVGGGEILTTVGTCIQNEGTTNDVVIVRLGNELHTGYSILQDSGVTPTAGFAMNVGIGTTSKIISDKIQNVTSYGTFQGLEINGEVNDLDVSASRFEAIENPLYYSVPTNYGDNHVHDSLFLTLTTTNQGASVVGSDITSFTTDKFLAGNPVLSITDTSGQVTGLRFNDCSFENAGGTNGGVNINATGSGIDVSFTGGELGNDNGNGGFTLAASTAGLANVSLSNLNWKNQTGTAIKTTANVVLNVAPAMFPNGSPNFPTVLAANVGIGTWITPAPLSILETTNPGFQITGKSGINSGTADFVTMSATGNSSWDFAAEDSGANNLPAFIIFDNVGSHSPFQIETNAPGKAFYIQASGNVGIGTWINPDTLSVKGGIQVIGNIAGGTTGNVGISTTQTGTGATCDSSCNTANKRCLIGLKTVTVGFEPCGTSVIGDCLCLSAT